MTHYKGGAVPWELQSCCSAGVAELLFDFDFDGAL